MITYERNGAELRARPWDNSRPESWIELSIGKEHILITPPQLKKIAEYFIHERRLV